MERLTERDENGKAWAKLGMDSPREETMKFGRKALNRLASYEDTGLTPKQIEAQQQEIDRLKDRNVTYVNENANQAKEIERLNEVLDDWKYNAKCDADHIAGLIADKDEQAGRIMRMEDGLKRLRISLQWIFETIGGFFYKEWAKEKIAAIDAMLGGKEDVPLS